MVWRISSFARPRFFLLFLKPSTRGTLTSIWVGMHYPLLLVLIEIVGNHIWAATVLLSAVFRSEVSRFPWLHMVPKVCV
jgi:hypothetical protein